MATGGGSSLDPDAQAFITAAGITDATQKTAINDLVVGLKADSLWTKMQAIYPNVGGTSTTCKYNLKDPRDLDVAFRKTFTGSLTFANTGVTSDGATGYANTHYSPASNGTNNSIHISAYSRTNSTAGNVIIGCGAWFAAGDDVVLSPSGIAGPGNAYVEITGTGAVNVATADTLGLLTATRTTSTLLKLFQRSAEAGSNTSAGVNISGTTDEIYVHCRNAASTPSNFSPLESAFESIGVGLDNTDVGNLYTLVQAFQTTLSRNV